jgi:hypothetical protein
MAPDIHQVEHLPQGLLKFPNELLLDIAAPLSPADLRHLSQVSRRLNRFVFHFQKRYTIGVNVLPNELILEVASYLGEKDKPTFARTNHRFYSLIMESTLFCNVREKGSSLLGFAVQRNLRGLARRLLERGADVNTKRNWYGGTQERPTPLLTAVDHGYGNLVNLLLHFRASQSLDKDSPPLAAAIAKRYESIALRLLRRLTIAGTLSIPTIASYLKQASSKKVFKVVQYLLEHRSRLRVKGTGSLDAALFHVLLADACTGDIIKRELHHDAYQIVELLLQHGANPDAPIDRPGGRKQTCRDLAAGHPDPRIRTSLAKVIRPVLTKALPSQIGRAWNVSSQTALSSSVSQPEEDYSVSLWDYLDVSEGDVPAASEESNQLTKAGSAGASTNNEREIHIGSKTDGVSEGEEDIYGARKSDSNEPPSLDSFPQLITPKERTQSVPNGLWTNASATVRSAPPLPVQRKTPLSTKLKVQPQTKTTPEEQFPGLKKSTGQSELFPNLETLGQKGTVAKDLWAALPKKVGLREVKGADTRSEEPEKTTSKKKKKWEPLLF